MNARELQSKEVSKTVMKAKKLETVIRNAKKDLIKKAKREGLYENMGQAYVRAMKDKFIDLSDYSDKMNSNRFEIRAFSEWASNLDLSDLRQYA